MADMQQMVPPSPTMEILQGDDQQGVSNDASEACEAGPDLPDEPPWEGRVNDPMPTRGPDVRRGQAENNSSANRQVLEILVPADPRLQGRDYLVGLDNALQQAAQMNVEEGLANDGTDVAEGLEGVMTDLSELIELLPLENAVEDSLPSYLQVLPKPLPVRVPAQSVPYNPAERPTSRWRCRWRLISPQDTEEHSLSDGLSAFMPREGAERMEFRNPYVKALNSTREELKKSWDLMAEASPASRLATERHDALASMQVSEVDDVCYRPQQNGLNRLMCLPEPCRETCRERQDQTEMCEVRICHPDFDHLLHRHPHSSTLQYLGAAAKPTPRPARCEDIMLKAGMHRGKVLVDEETPNHGQSVVGKRS